MIVKYHLIKIILFILCLFYWAVRTQVRDTFWGV